MEPPKTVFFLFMWKYCGAFSEHKPKIYFAFYEYTTTVAHACSRTLKRFKLHSI